MKKLLLLTLILGFSVSMSAQKKTKPTLSAVNAQGRIESQVKLCQLVAHNLKDGKVKIIVDFGDTTKFNKRQMEEITKEGYDESFPNMIDALRYMSEKGWQLIEDYEIMGKESKTLYFVLKRR